MAVKIFGQYLLERGVITRDMLLDAIQYQKNINQPLCALALKKGYLTKEQLQQLDEGAKESDGRFMELAVRRNMLTFQQLEELAQTKSERWLFLGEALVQRGHVNLVQLQQYLDEYRKQQTDSGATPSATLPDMPERFVVASMLDVTVDLFVHYTKQIVQVTSVETVRAEPDDIACVFAQHVTGDKDFFYALALPEMLTLSIASHILEEKQSVVNDTVLDAVSEFVNVVIGNGCTRLSIHDYKVHAEAPRVMTKEMIKKLLPSEVIAVNMKTTRGDFRVFFFFNLKHG